MRVSSEEEELGLDATQHNENYVQGTLLLRQKGAAKETEIKIEKGTVEEFILD